MTNIDAIRARNRQEHPRFLDSYPVGSTEWEWLRAAMDRRDLLAEVDRLTAERDELAAAVERGLAVADDCDCTQPHHKKWRSTAKQAQAERDEARATNTRLNLRLTKAEAAMRVTIEDCKRQGVSFGRSLANAAYLMVEAERDELRATVERVQALADSTAAEHSSGVAWTNLDVRQVHDDLRAALQGKYQPVWDNAIPPGGMVCNLCGMPVETEPCREHALPQHRTEAGWPNCCTDPA